MIVLALLLGSAPARAASLVISNGDGQLVNGGDTATWDTVTIEGFDAGRSAYSILGTLVVTGSGDPNIASVDLLDQGLLDIAAVGTATVAGYAEVTTSGLLQVNGAASFTDGVFAYDGGQVTIGASGSLNAGSYLYLSGAGAFSRSVGGAYATGTLSVADGAAANVTATDTISGDVLVDSLATLTLDSNLSIPTATLFLAGGGSISRTSQSITVATLDIDGGSSLALLATDSVGSTVLHGGGQATAAAPLSLKSLTISGSFSGGTPSTLTATDTLSISSAGTILVSGGGRLDAAGGISGDGATTITVTGDSSRLIAAGATGIATTSIATGGILETTPGTFTTDTLSLSGPGAFVRSGGGYSVGHLQLSGTSLAYTAADTISVEAALSNAATLSLSKNLALSGNLVLDGGSALTRSDKTIAAAGLLISGASSFAIKAGDAFSSLDLATGGSASTASALALDSLTIDGSGSAVTLGAFDGSIGHLSWALSLSGDQHTLLASYLAGGRILHGSTPYTVAAVYDLATYGNVTYVGYVTPVPEPSTLAMVAVALAGIAAARRATRR